MSKLQSDIHAWLQANRDAGTALLQQLVNMPTLQGNERNAQLFMADKMRNIGLEVDMWELDGEDGEDGKRLKMHPYFYSPRDDFKGSPNVVGVCRGTGGGRSIILNGHVDVVPEGNRELWDDDPFGGVIKDGKLFGRGATDMKGGSVSLLLAVQALQELGVKLQGDVIVQSVVEEESGGAGTLAAILRSYKADAALIPEPTNMKIFPKQQGSMWFRLHIKGRSAHGGTRYEGVSAIELAMPVITHLQTLEQVRNARITDPLYASNPIPIPINIGTITGGNWPSSVPDTVQLEGRMGVAPDESLEQAKQEMADWLARLAEQHVWFRDNPPILEWFGARWVPGSVDADHELLSILAQQYRNVRHEEPVIEASPWGTDGGLLTVLAETPCIVFGPGETKVAHYPNEYMELERMFEAAEIIALTLVQWCGVEGFTNECK
ncbi:peptidase [Paenibacillus sp. 481]|uniref:peptidase n=1 Tax=Paenibacillus sp. 481 TaxID=2835869 RepID=UPI003FA794F7